MYKFVRLFKGVVYQSGYISIHIDLSSFIFVQVSTIKYQALSVRLYSIFGQEIVPDIARNTNGFIIRRNNLANGIYFYEIKSSDKIISVEKFIITD
ncbi:MAG: T9SS type A sorting domain-containing protein [Bacteroidota bacterium]